MSILDQLATSLNRRNQTIRKRLQNCSYCSGIGIAITEDAAGEIHASLPAIIKAAGKRAVITMDHCEKRVNERSGRK